MLSVSITNNSINEEVSRLNLVRDGVFMAVYVFVVIVIYIVLSSPFADVMSDFEDINSTGSDSHVESGVSIATTVFDMVFAAFVIIPLFWFMVRVFMREPDWRQ